MYGGPSSKLGRTGGPKRLHTSFPPPPPHRLPSSSNSRLSLGGSARKTPPAVEETFSLVSGNNPLAFSMIIRLVPDLVEEIKRVEALGGTARMKFDPNPNNPNGNIIDVGGKEFRFTWSRDGDLCDIYEQRQSGEDGNDLLVESGCAWRKVNIQRILDEATKNHVKMRSEEAECKLKSRKAIVLDPGNPSMKNQIKALPAVETTTWKTPVSKRNNGSKPVDFQSMLISLLKDKPNGMTFKALEKVVSDTLPCSVMDIEAIIKRIAKYQTPGRYILKPEMVPESFEKPQTESGSSPEENHNQIPVHEEFHNQTSAPQGGFEEKVPNDILEETMEVKFKAEKESNTIEKIDVQHASPDIFGDKKGSDYSEGRAGSSSASGSDSDSESDSSDSGSDSGSHSKSRSRSPARSGSGSSSDSESDASSSSKEGLEGSDVDVDIMSDDEKEPKHKEARDQMVSLPIPVKSPDVRSMQNDVDEKQDGNESGWDSSNNSLNGSLPDFLIQLKSLKVVNVGKNKLIGLVPSELLERSKTGSLSLSVDDNLGLCKKESCRKKSLFKPLIVSISVLIVILLISLGFWILGRKKVKSSNYNEMGPMKSNHQEFSYPDILDITDNYKTTIGEKGFGKVYIGVLQNHIQVAVKILSPSSMQGYKEFQSEAQFLMIVHHRNLVSLIGYCDEGEIKALVYEYMANGNLQQHLLVENSNILKWNERLNIGFDAAHGLDYLHNGCKPPIMHRDLKPSNILLDENMHAKIADFGLSRAFGNDNDSKYLHALSVHLVMWILNIGAQETQTKKMMSTTLR